MSVAGLLLMLVLTLPQIPVEPPLLAIDVTWVKLPVMVYADYQGSKCSPEENRAILDIVPMALEIHYQSNIRYIAEFVRESYIIEVKQTSNPSQAQVTLTAEKLDRAAGIATATTWDPITSTWKDVRIKLDCMMARAIPEARITVFLHELYHTLGVGHPDEGNMYELMGGAAWNMTVYPSTLDFYALYAVRRTMTKTYVRLPSNIPYVMLEPYNVTLSKLAGRVGELETRLNQTTLQLRLSEQEVEALRKTLENDVAVLDSRVDVIEGRLENVEATLYNVREDNSMFKQQFQTVDKELKSQASRLDSIAAEVGGLRGSYEPLSSRVSGIINAIDELRTQLERLTEENRRLTLLSITSCMLAASAVVATAALAAKAVRKTGHADEASKITG